MIKIKERKRMSRRIYVDIVERIQEFGVKAEKGNLNEAYFLAFQIGLEADIEDSLKKCKASCSAETMEDKDENNINRIQ